MRNNYNKNSNRPGSGKRVGKSNPNKNRKPEFKKGKYIGETEKNQEHKKFSGKKPFRKSAPRKSAQPAAKSESDGIRLNRFIANAGICSRREADKYIETGMVTINGKQITELGVKVKPGDEVRFDGQRIFAQKKVYVLLNKPKNFVTTTDDPHAERTVMELVENACEERIYPVGRLDRNTTGLLLFTNDGELSKKLTHPSYNKKKIYQVTLDKPVTKAHLQEIMDGIELEDGPVAADNISFVKDNDKTEVGIEIHSGKNRIVRRIFEHFGYHVRKLDRVYFAGLTKKNLPRGKWRILSEKEVGFLKMS